MNWDKLLKAALMSLGVIGFVGSFGAFLYGIFMYGGVVTYVVVCVVVAFLVLTFSMYFGQELDP